MAKKVSDGRKASKSAAPHKATFSLSNLKPPKGSRHRKVRVGRGIGSKLGKTSGSGDKGQESSRGYLRRSGFEMDELQPTRRMPKRGFHNPFSVEYSVLNLEELNVFPAGETVTPELLRAHGFVRRSRDRIKVLGDGELTTKLAIHAHAFSESAKEKITKAGGTFEVVA